MMKGFVGTLKRSFLFQWIATQYIPEVICLFKLAWPIMLMNLCRLLNPTISVIMCGHLTKRDFDAASLANALINVFGVSIDMGFSTACDTLFAQVYGSKNKMKLGLMLQRAILVMSLVYLILVCFLLNIEPMLILLSQDVEISRLGARYVTFYLPGLFFDFIFLAVSRYLQNQNIVYPMMVSSLLGCIYNAVAQYVTIYVYNYGIISSAIIQATSCALMFFTQLFYILYSKVYKSTWQGIEFANALEGWGIFFKLGLPGIVMIAVEEWTFEIGNFLAGALSDVQLGAQSIAYQTAFTFFMIHVGIAISGTIRSGQFLGANMPKLAALSAKVAVITDWLCAIITFSVILSLRKYIPYVFTNDQEIILFAEKILVLVAGIQFLDSSISQGAAIFRACGKQLTGAIIMVLSYYTIGVPLGMVFMFVLKTDIRGFWIGLIVALGIECLIYYIIIYRIDWQAEADKADHRVKESRLSGSSQQETQIDDFSTVFVSEKTNLIDSSENIEEPTKLPVILVKPAHRRPTSDVTDIFIASLKEAPNISSPNGFNKRTVIKRLIFSGITVSLLVLSLLIKIYLPRRYYIPCIPVNNTTSHLSLDKHYPYCNDTMYIV